MSLPAVNVARFYAPSRTLRFGLRQRGGRARAGSRTPRRLPCNTMVYEVLVVSDGGGGERFAIERDAPLSDGQIFEQGSNTYRILTIQPGHGPFDGIVEAEWL